jgi:ABC-2 type transport system ATP-binding protein
MLEFAKVKKSYGTRLVLSIPSAQLSPGIYWLQGVNGSGKTTLLRMIAGLLSFKGDIYLNGHSLRKDPIAYRRAVSWADAEPRYPGFLTGADILSFYLSIRKTPSSQAEGLMEMFSMQSYIATPIGSWSDGMVKKLSLILAFLGDPSLLVLDEPFVSLDTASVALLYQVIRDHRRKGCSLLLTSHQDVDEDVLPLDMTLLIREQTLQAKTLA